MRTVVVVGASLAGLRAAQALRKRGFSGRLVLIGAEPHASYDRPPLSKQLLAGEWPAQKLFFGAREQHAALDLEQRLGVSACALDARDRAVVLDNSARERVRYDGLIIATGATARTLPAAAGLSGVHPLRTLDDALAIRAALDREPRIVVLGAGFIGLEVAASCRKLGLAVTIVEPQPLPLLGPLGEAAAKSVLRLHQEHGVDLRLGRSVTAVSGHGRVERLTLDDGTQLECDLLVLGIGVDPEIGWLQGSGVQLDKGVLCDASLATNVPDVVAAGDVVRWPNAAAGSELMSVPHWSNAVEQGQAAAARLLDGPAAPAFGHLPYFWSDQYDRKLQSAGRVHPSDSFELVQGSIEAASFVGLYAQGERLTGVLTSNAPAAFLRVRKLLAQAASLTQARATFK